jgi:pimeloyl-ACP methyl ester carboxylesterase
MSSNAMCVDGDVVDAVDVGGLRIAFQREGRGPPLELLHGFVGDGSALGLSARGAVRRVHRYRLGWSRSRPFISLPESFRLADYAECLSGFLRALDLAHPYVAGCCSALYWR